MPTDCHHTQHTHQPMPGPAPHAHHSGPPPAPTSTMCPCVNFCLVVGTPHTMPMSDIANSSITAPAPTQQPAPYQITPPWVRYNPYLRDQTLEIPEALIPPPHYEPHHAPHHAPPLPPHCMPAWVPPLQHANVRVLQTFARIAQQMRGEYQGITLQEIITLAQYKEEIFAEHKPMDKDIYNWHLTMMRATWRRSVRGGFRDA
jgi:hypothetical protein